ncbi:MAG TPA: SDR family NAD(P)-dependent oxidoreductase, partial [Thermoanaerobaculia bacterium]|nr:SDR family NAD(P)-dependent oxidoreductase [Thermoanaerobaculia bacterium]
RVKELEALGGEVLALAADVADPEAMGRAVAVARQRFGAIHGVIHAAGTQDAASFAPIQQLRREQCETHFRSKARGIQVLMKALAGEDLDFVFLFSSLASVLGGIGFAAYTAANLFLDGCARDRDRKTGRARWISVNWDSWRVRQETREAEAMGLESSLAELAMNAEEGLEAFRRVLASDAGPQWTHSTGDLHARLDQWIFRTSLRAEKKAPGVLYSRPSLQTAYVPVSNDAERTIARIWQEVLGIDRIGVHDNYFDLGGTSLNGIQLVAELQKAFEVEVSAALLLEAPTVAELARRLSPQAEPLRAAPVEPLVPVVEAAKQEAHPEGIAIVGMAGRFPGARSVEELWRNLRTGAEALSFLTDEELREAGVDPVLIHNRSYVKARPILGDSDLFDASFFGYGEREAALMDPQHRMFLEVSWEALESAGYVSPAYAGSVGVFAGSNISTYLFGLMSDPELTGSATEEEVAIANDRDSLATRVSYKLDLKGPSLTVQTFCSTSAVATHLACQSLLNGESDMALAGGVSIRAPETVGYLHKPGGKDSPDGHTRSFDESGRGTATGDGVGVVVLKRLADALADGDHIHAVIRGSAVNNDGSLKMGYTAPSTEGLTTVVRAALDKAGVSAETMGYVEAHGTATELGDFVEVTALTRAYRLYTSERQYCALGSVKSNVGHLDRAAGVAALIKTALALEHGEIPPSLHFKRPNPRIDFESSPFYVNTALSEWKANGTPRRAGVSSFGVGGTNVHLVLEEAPLRHPGGSSRSWQLLVLSARTAAALDRSAANLAGYLRTEPEAELPDVAFTLHVGRRAFEHRRFLVCRSREEAVESLLSQTPTRVSAPWQEAAQRQAVFLFPEPSEPWTWASADLHHQEPAFRQAFDRCQELLGTSLERNPRAALFAAEYALARLWMESGVHPQALAGEGTGALVAACLAGVLSLEEALGLVAGSVQLDRARLSAPRVPVLSSATGTWLSPDEAVDPELWAGHLRQPARFGPDVREQVASGGRMLVAVGPMPSAEPLLPGRNGHELLIQPTLSRSPEEEPDQKVFLESLGRLWSAGVEVDWAGFYRHERRRRLRMPTYPFERRRYWLGRGGAGRIQGQVSSLTRHLSEE